jgi:bisphosphoglycerate-independent phosphoglycerate mutase (AlkP superfamily)
MHHPDGTLWIRKADRRHAEDSAKVPLGAVAPTLLDLLGIPKPELMRHSSVFGVPELERAGALSSV